MFYPGLSYKSVSLESGFLFWVQMTPGLVLDHTALAGTGADGTDLTLL